MYEGMSPCVENNPIDAIASNGDLLQMQLGELCLVGWRALFGCSNSSGPFLLLRLLLTINLKLPRQSFFSSNDGKIAYLNEVGIRPHTHTF